MLKILKTNQVALIPQTTTNHNDRNDDLFDIIQQAKTNPEAFAELYDRYYNLILIFIYHRALDLDLAEDLTSNTFYKIIKSLSKYHHKVSFKAWLYRIALNEIRMYYRSMKSRLKREYDYQEFLQSDRVTFSIPDVEYYEDEKEAKHRFLLIHTILKKIPEKYRTVITLRYFEELSYNEIAMVLEKRVGTVKSLLHRGLKRMRKIYEKQNATFL